MQARTRNALLLKLPLPDFELLANGLRFRRVCNTAISSIFSCGFVE
jgi:hypothetical protein